MKKKISLIKLITTAIMLPTVGAVIYIMYRGLGLSDKLDFGAGAYYYADIPEFQRFTGGDYYTSGTPMWVIILLFLIWGFVMYRLWVRIESKKAGDR